MKITVAKILLFLIIVASAIFVCWYFRTIISYILISGVLSLVANPLCRLIDNFKIYKGKSLSSSASAFITLIIIFIIFLGIIAIFIPVLVSEVNALASLDEQRLMKNFEQPINQIQNLYNSVNIGNGKSLTTFISDKIKDIVDAKFVTDLTTSAFNSIGDFVAALFSILFISFFFLKDEKLLVETVVKFIPNKYENETRLVFNESKKQLINYFSGLLIQFLSVSTLASLGMWIVGVDYPLLMGLLFGFLNLVPYVGPIIAAAIGVVIAVSTNLYLDVYSALLPMVVKVLAVYGTVQFIDNWFLSNYIFSKSMEVHPLEIFIVILLSATLGGVVGMMVAIPVYSVLRIVGRAFWLNMKKIQIEVE
jgi:predicted PurR-regulated permease PerM